MNMIKKNMTGNESSFIKDKGDETFKHLSTKVRVRPNNQFKEKRDRHLEVKAFTNASRGPGTYKVNEIDTSFKP